MRSRASTRSARSSIDEDDARAERGADGPGALEGQRDVELVGADKHAGRAAEQDRLDLAAVRCAGDAAREVEQLAEGRPERDLVQAGPA